MITGEQRGILLRSRGIYCFTRKGKGRLHTPRSRERYIIKQERIKLCEYLIYALLSKTRTHRSAEASLRESFLRAVLGFGRSKYMHTHTTYNNV